jgi:hypothetical protein
MSGLPVKWLDSPDFKSRLTAMNAPPEGTSCNHSASKNLTPIPLFSRVVKSIYYSFIGLYGIDGLYSVYSVYTRIYGLYIHIYGVYTYSVFENHIQTLKPYSLVAVHDLAAAQRLRAAPVLFRWQNLH